MKRFFYGTCLVLLISLIISCGANSKSDSEIDNNKTEQSKDNPNAENTEKDFVSQQKTVNGYFGMVALSTSGAIITFEDEDGNEYDFYDKNPDVIGMDLIRDIEPNNPMHALENVLFEITFENRMVEFYDGSTGEHFDREELVLIEIKDSKNSTNKSVSTELNAEVLSTLTLHGTEPFWTIELYDYHAIFISPEVTDLKMYYLYKYDEDMGFGTLAESVEPQDDGSLSIRIQAEGTSDITRLTISKGECSDGMSENVYDYTVYYQFNDGYKQQACGNVRTEK